MTDLSFNTRATSIDLAITCLDLTSLEGSETEEQLRTLCDRATQPDSADDSVPSVAAVVLYPRFISQVGEMLGGSTVKVAAVNAFPLPDAPLDERLAEIRRAVADGADEIDMVLNRGLMERGASAETVEEIARSKEAAAGALLKVILETGELGTPERIREAALLAVNAGADFIKSSTGKVGSGVTREAALTMMEVARAHAEHDGRAVGVKLSGGVRTVEDALGYLELVERTLGEEWLRPERFRIGASSLLDELVRARREA